MLTNPIVVTISRYIRISNHLGAYLKLTQCYIPVLSQESCKKYSGGQQQGVLCCPQDDCKQHLDQAFLRQERIYSGESKDRNPHLQPWRATFKFPRVRKQGSCVQRERGSDGEGSLQHSVPRYHSDLPAAPSHRRSARQRPPQASPAPVLDGVPVLNFDTHLSHIFQIANPWLTKLTV